MATYKANHSFDDDRLGKIKRDQSLELSESQAEPYKRSGLIRQVVGPSVSDASPNPIPAAGTVQSASPAAPALPPTIAQKPRRGRKAKAAGQSLS